MYQALDKDKNVIFESESLREVADHVKDYTTTAQIVTGPQSVNLQKLHGLPARRIVLERSYSTGIWLECCHSMSVAEMREVSIGLGRDKRADGVPLKLYHP